MALEIALAVVQPCAPVPSCQLVHPGEGGVSVRFLMNGYPLLSDLAAQLADMSSSLACRGSTPGM